MSDALEGISGRVTSRTQPRKLRRVPNRSSVDEGSSFRMPPSQQRSDASEGDSLDEREMKRHLMDVESSFLPDASMPPAPLEGRPGADDTYLELAKGRGHDDEEEHATSDTAYESSEHTGYDDEGDEEGDSSLNHSSFSPTAAAARRTHVRNVSAASANTLKPFRGSATSAQPTGQGRNSTSGTSPSQRPLSSGTTVRQTSSPSEDEAAPQAQSARSSLLSSNGGPSLSASRSNIASRDVSHRSTASSSTILSNLSGSDDALSLDYPLLSGGSLADSKAHGSTRAQNFLSRLPSLGSLNSFASNEDHPAPGRGGGGASASLRASRGIGRLEEKDDEDRPETPRATHSNFRAPTDTVIAQHVQSIQVPETVARDFRARNRSLSPEKRPASSGGFGIATTQDRPRRTLTLKEQNSKIDKLTKENFDLKLKIHFLDQALQNRSDDGVKELIEKNVQFQTDLANERKETQGLRRKVKELERKMKEAEEAIREARAQRASKDDDDDDPTLQAEMHEEILYLRQQLDRSENQVSTLREEMLFKESEKRKMAEHMRTMANKRGEDTAGMKETMDMWQDLLNAETGRREQAEEDLQKLRDELTALRIERASPAANRMVRQERRRSRLGSTPTLVNDDDSDIIGGANGAEFESNAVLVEQLKHENAELRRDLGAQTSMLTSRNRERERLQQEIEDLKLLQRKGDGARSVAGESIFDRSISRAHQRAPSRTSDAGMTHITEAERDDWDRKEGKLRDQNAELRLRFQELERTHNTHLQYVSALEGDFQDMEQELNESQEDLIKLQTERDETLQAYDEKEAELAQLKEEALAEITALDEEKKELEAQLQGALTRHQKTQAKLQNTTDGYKGLQSELRDITQSVMNLEDEKQANMRMIQTLEQQMQDAEDEIQKWEQKGNEMDQKNRKLEITQESLQAEVTFLREEQEGDKIKIGELEDALHAAQQTIQDEQEKLREIEDSVVEERQQRDALENKSREDVQKILDDLNSEHAKVKDEVRKLRRSLSAKEVEGSSWKQKLEDLELGLRHALSNPDGTKSTLLAGIAKLQRDLETTASSLDRAKMDVADKDRLLRHREGLLESSSLESRRLSDLLDKERASRKHELEQFEKASRGQATHMRAIAQHETRVLELESAWTQDKRKMANLEEQYREQLHERNNLLLALWNRLSTICGADWAQTHSLVNGEVPSAEAISRYLPSFNKNIISAVKTIEALLGSFKTRIRGIEKDLWRDYQTLEHNLDIRVRRMDALERAVIDAQRALAEEAAERRPSAPSRSGSARNTRGSEEIGKLKGEIKLLKAELKFHRQHPSAMAQQMLNQQNQLHPEHSRRQSSGGSSNKSSQSPARAIVSHLLRHHSTGAVEQLPSPIEDQPLQQPRHQTLVVSDPTVQPSEQRWVHRLKEMERRLKAEREARLMDRRGARQRLEERNLENEELRQALEKEKIRQEGLDEVHHHHDDGDDDAAAYEYEAGDSAEEQGLTDRSVD